MTTAGTPTSHQEASATGSMRAAVRDRYGEAGDVLRVEHVERPSIGAGEVLVRVHAAGVDRGAWHLMAGLPYALRLAGFGVRAPKERVLGREVAGTVVAVGEGVTGFEPGDEVFGIAEGSFAELARARADKLAPKPTGLGFADAAASTISAITALQAVRDHGRVKAGQSVLVIGASGGVGTFAVQIAKALGAEVTAVASTPKLDLVRSIGADHVVDYSREDITAGGARYDTILDIAGNRPLRVLRRALAPNGTLVIIGGEGGGQWIGGTDRQLRAVLLSPLVGQKLGTFISSENAEDLRAIADLVESGQVRPVVDRVFPLDGAVAAIDHMQSGRARGKVVIDVAGGASSPA